MRGREEGGERERERDKTTQVKEHGVVVCKGKEGGRERGRENIEIINIDVLD